jgi:hypothetical protein
MLSAVVTTALLGFLLSRFPNLTTRMIYMSFDLRLPPHVESYVLYLLSLCAWVFAMVALVLSGRPFRVRTLGLLLIGLGGCQSKTLHQMMYYLAGLLCIAENLLDARGYAEAAPALERRAV